MKNENIIEFLDYYIGKQSPKYAVLLSGKWGSGKTYFINDYIKNKKKDESNPKFAKISLFGKKDTEQIDDVLIIGLKI